MGDLFRKEVSGFCSHKNIKMKGANNGPLKKLTFAVKDIIDVAGSVTGAGNIKFFSLTLIVSTKVFRSINRW